MTPWTQITMLLLYHQKLGVRAGKMAQWIRQLAENPDELMKSIPKTHVVVHFQLTKFLLQAHLGSTERKSRHQEKATK